MQFLSKEHEVRGCIGYQNETANYLDFLSLFMKIIRSDFCTEMSRQKTYNTDKIVTSTSDFLKELETVTYELSKLALQDCYLRRYLKSYVSGSILIYSLELLLDRVDQFEKLDLSHMVVIHQVTQKMLTKFFGYNKYVHLQIMGKFIFNRFQCFYFQYSGILNQQKTFIQ